MNKIFNVLAITNVLSILSVGAVFLITNSRWSFLCLLIPILTTIFSTLVLLSDYGQNNEEVSKEMNNLLKKYRNKIK
jgi:hypothetical protein